MNDFIYRHIVSFVTTFLASFFTILGGELLSGTIDFSHLTGAIILGLLLGAVRGALKVASEGLGFSGDVTAQPQQ